MITSIRLFGTLTAVPVNQLWNRGAAGLTRAINPDAFFFLQDRLRLLQGKDQIGSLLPEFKPISRTKTEGVPDRLRDHQPTALIDYQGRARNGIL